MTKVLTDEIHTLLSDTPILHERLHRAGLHATGQLMHEVVRKLGFEVAAKIEDQEGE